MNKILSLNPEPLGLYVLICFGGAVIVGLVNAGVTRWIEQREVPFRFRFLSFSIGFLEILAYPIFIRGDLLEAIAFWLGFKTIYRWYGDSRRSSQEQGTRGTYNRYLLSNGLVFLASYLLARFFYWT